MNFGIPNTNIRNVNIAMTFMQIINHMQGFGYDLWDSGNNGLNEKIVLIF